MKKLKKTVYFLMFFMILAFASVAAHGKAFDYYGVIDQQKMLNNAEKETITAILKETYDKYGVSAYIHIAPKGTESMQLYVEDFWVNSVGPYYPDEIKRGLTMAWDGNNFYASAFPNTDGVIMEAYNKDYLMQAAGSSFGGASSVGQAYTNFAKAVQTRAAEYYGPNASKTAKTVTPQLTDEQKAWQEAAKAKFYDLDGDKVVGVYAAVGARDLLSAQTGNEGGAAYLAAAYKTANIQEDVQNYAKALNTEKWMLTKQEGAWDAGSISLAKESREKGKILVMTIELKGNSFQVNVAKMPGTVSQNK